MTHDSDFSGEPEAEGLTVSESEDIAVAGEPEDSRRLCVNCNERDIDFSENELSLLCSECRQQYLKLAVPPRIKLFLVAVCVVFLFATVSFIPVLTSYRTYLEAEKHMRAKEYSFAYKKYYEVLEKYSYSVGLVLKTSDAAMSAQYFGELAYIFDDYLVGKNLNDKDYQRALKHSDFLSLYYRTCQEIDDIFEAANDAYDIEDDSTELRGFIRLKLEELLLNEELDKTVIYYTLALVTDDRTEAAEYLRLSSEQDPRQTYPYAFYGNSLRRMGEYDKARRVFQKAVELNANDALAWRGLGVLQLLEGQKDSGLESIRLAFEIEPYGLYVAEALIIALNDNGQRE
ncbi:MAG: tetratricopeptide repeat protein, partial [Oscillospiraceae bacterium]|nr:tetratricopeptide repeat protein [Oscillospiraceae bacterium]